MSYTSHYFKEQLELYIEKSKGGEPDFRNLNDPLNHEVILAKR